MKSCFGDYMGTTCEGHIGCPHEGECFKKKSIEKGACDCQYKAHCHIPRQYVAAKAKKEIPDYTCRFYEYFEADRKK